MFNKTELHGFFGYIGWFVSDMKNDKKTTKKPEGMMIQTLGTS